jgi:hypothetical protein
MAEPFRAIPRLLRSQQQQHTTAGMNAHGCMHTHQHSKECPSIANQCSTQDACVHLVVVLCPIRALHCMHCHLPRCSAWMSDICCASRKRC